MSGKIVHTAQQRRVLNLYRDLVKNSRSWVIDIDIWRQQALEIREHFDKNKGKSSCDFITTAIDLF